MTYLLPMAERVGCPGTRCLFGSLGVQEVVGSWVYPLGLPLMRHPATLKTMPIPGNYY